MKEQEVMLKSYRREIEVLSLEMDVPQYEPDDERGKFLPKYEDVLLKLFNNKREDRSILKIENYYGSNAITIHIDLTYYLENCVDYGTTREEAIDHLKNWYRGNLDISLDDIDTRIYKGHVYAIPEYENHITSFNRETEEYEPNYVEWEDL